MLELEGGCGTKFLLSDSTLLDFRIAIEQSSQPIQERDEEMHCFLRLIESEHRFGVGVGDVPIVVHGPIVWC
jgi:hypothetical protein